MQCRAACQQPCGNAGLSYVRMLASCCGVHAHPTAVCCSVCAPVSCQALPQPPSPHFPPQHYQDITITRTSQMSYYRIVSGSNSSVHADAHAEDRT